MEISTGQGAYKPVLIHNRPIGPDIGIAAKI